MIQRGVSRGLYHARRKKGEPRAEWSEDLEPDNPTGFRCRVVPVGLGWI